MLRFDILMQYIGTEGPAPRSARGADRRGASAVFRRLVLRLGHKTLFGAVVRHFGARFDRVIYRATRGRFSPTATVAPVLLLTTTGRRTGRARTTPVMYIRAGENYVVSSEDVGQRRPAAWPLNLGANAAATVQLGGVKINCRARRLSDAEADIYWPRLLEIWPAHETYRQRSGTRHTFLLEPAAP
jgi:deazaflavin-dependent oxidoreductase (nitroreductase family)